jgi:hypothetical protein
MQSSGSSSGAILAMPSTFELPSVRQAANW